MTSFAVFFAVEGERRPRKVMVEPGINAHEFLGIVVAETGRTELCEVFVEDADESLEPHAALEHGEAFKLFHVATHGLIRVIVSFNGVTHQTDMRPNATVTKIVRWAVAAFHLEGDAGDFQLKSGSEILPPGDHLGQIAHGEKEVRFSLVMKIKPQG